MSSEGNEQGGYTFNQGNYGFDDGSEDTTIVAFPAQTASFGQLGVDATRAPSNRIDFDNSEDIDWGQAGFEARRSPLRQEASSEGCGQPAFHGEPGRRPQGDEQETQPLQPSSAKRKTLWLIAVATVFIVAMIGLFAFAAGLDPNDVADSSGVASSASAADRSGSAEETDSMRESASESDEDDGGDGGASADPASSSGLSASEGGKASSAVRGDAGSASAQSAAGQTQAMRTQWQIVSYVQTGYGGYDDESSGDWQGEYSYDSENRLAKQVVTMTDGNTTATTTRQFEYRSDGALGKVIEYDDNGQVTCEIAYEQDAKAASAIKRSPSGETIKSYYCTLDDAGRVESVNLGEGQFSVEYGYDGDGRLSFAHYNEGDENYLNRFLYEDGRLVQEDDAPSASARDIEYGYDNHGTCISRRVSGADNANGAVIDAASFDFDTGKAVCDDCTVEFETDDAGNVVKRTFRRGNTVIGTSLATYREAATAADADDVFQPLLMGDPASAPLSLLPCTVNLMSGQDPVVERHGPFVMRTL